jgi:hypothetical protein
MDFRSSRQDRKSYEPIESSPNALRVARRRVVGKGRQKEPTLWFIQLFHWMLRTEAWKDLRPVARALYVELSGRYRGTNNGEIFYSVRQASKALKVSKDTAARAFEELQRHGFIAVQRKGGFNLKEQKGQATVWRLTEFICCSAVSGTKDFTRWSAGNDFPIHRGPKPTHKRKQKHTPLANYTCPKEGTAALDNSSFKSQEKDQNVVSMQHESQQRDWLVLKDGPQVSPQRPCFEIRRSRFAS